MNQLKSRAPEQVQTLAGNLTDLSLLQRAVELAIRSFGKVDALIVNHGTLGEVKRIADCDPAGWQKTFDVNLISAVACVKAAIPELRKTNGHIIFTSSGAAQNAYSTWGAYGASKAAMNHLAMTLKNEEPLITTVAIRPGVVDSEMQREIREVHHTTMDEKDQKKFSAAKTEGSLLRPEQPGNVIARLALDVPAEMSGKFISWNDEALKAFQD